MLHCCYRQAIRYMHFASFSRAVFPLLSRTQSGSILELRDLDLCSGLCSSWF